MFPSDPRVVATACRKRDTRGSAVKRKKGEKEGRRGSYYRPKLVTHGGEGGKMAIILATPYLFSEVEKVTFAEGEGSRCLNIPSIYDLYVGEKRKEEKGRNI